MPRPTASLALFSFLSYVTRVPAHAQALRNAVSTAAQVRLGRYLRTDASVVWSIGLLLTLCYTLRYLGDPNLPGIQASHPLGWWGWFDQSATLRSTAALARLDLDPSQHHYPLGYALLGLPFYSLARNHPFFFVDLLSLIGAYAGFVGLARRLALPGVLAASLFAAVTLGDGVLFRQWVLPWNTTPVAAFAWLLAASCAAWLDGRRRPFAIGLLAGALAACRPSDIVVILPCLATLAWAERRAWRGRLGAFLRLAAGAVAVLAPIVALHLAIYGPAESSYMRSSAQIGFTLHDLGWKAYVLYVDPYPWFADGEGLLQRAPWIAAGLAGFVPALFRGAKDRMLAGMLAAHGVLYVSYVDLLPTGFWRFMNVHYFVWAMPGYALLAALLLRDFANAAGWTRRVAWASVAVTAGLLCVRVVPKAVAEDQPAKAVDFAGPLPPFLDTFFAGRLALRDGRGVLRDGTGIRGFIYPGGVRVIGLRRDLVGPIAWLPGGAPQGFGNATPSARWGISVRFAWPPPWLRRAPAPGIPVPVQ